MTPGLPRLHLLCRNRQCPWDTIAHTPGRVQVLLSIWSEGIVAQYLFSAGIGGYMLTRHKIGRGITKNIALNHPQELLQTLRRAES